MTFNDHLLNWWDHSFIGIRVCQWTISKQYQIFPKYSPIFRILMTNNSKTKAKITTLNVPIPNTNRNIAIFRCDSISKISYVRHPANQPVSNTFVNSIDMDCMVKKFIGGHLKHDIFDGRGWRHRKTSRKYLKVLKYDHF